MLFKQCPRCEGDLYLRDQIDSLEVVCLQCSRVLKRENRFMSRFSKDFQSKAKVKQKIKQAKVRQKIKEKVA